MRNERSEFAVRVEHGGHSVILRLAGEMDLASRDDWQRAIAQATARRYRSVIVDMSGVSFIDPSGLGCLIATHHDLRDAGIELSVIDPPESVQRLCDMAGVFAVVRDDDLS